MLKDGLVGILLGILISSFLISCGVPIIEEIPSHTTTGRLFDLTKYTELGFLITPEETYTGKYDSIGPLTIERMPEARKVTALHVDTVKSKKKGFLNVEAQAGRPVKTLAREKWKVGVITQKDLDETMDDLYQKAKGKGADAIVNFKFEDIRQRVADTNKILVLVGIRVSGFAIKRLD